MFCPLKATSYTISCGWLCLKRYDTVSRVSDDAVDVYRVMLQASLDAHQATIVDLSAQVRLLQRDKASREDEIAALVEEIRRYTASKVV